MDRLAFCIVLVLVMMWSNCLHAQEPSKNHSPNESHSALPWLNLESLSSTRERPLFARDRRKPVPPSVSAVPGHREAVLQVQAPQKPNLQLTGIIQSPSETIVLLRDPATSEFVTVHPGETVGRWRVLMDSNYIVTLKDGAEEIRLEMYPEP